MGSVVNEAADRPRTGWAVQVSADDLRRRQERSKRFKKWLSWKSLLLAVLVVWNGWFLAAVLYGMTATTPDQGLVTRIVVTVWFWGDVAIVLAALAIWAILQTRRAA